MKKRTKSYRHSAWCWSDKDTGFSIDVADLTEEEAKDALCESIKLLESLSYKMKEFSIELEKAGFCAI